MDTKFSVAVHALILISESNKPSNSDQMAESIGTNASYVRKILALLKRSKIIDGHRGTGGYTLNISSVKLTLLKIYQAVMQQPRIHILDIHQNSNNQCIVGKNIKSALTGIFENMEASFTGLLAEKTLEDCIAAVHKEKTLTLSEASL